MDALFKKLEQAVNSGDLLDDSLSNMRSLLTPDAPAYFKESVEELVTRGEWNELNDRFFRQLAFGTGGLRGRTIGKVVTKAEMAVPTDLGRPEFTAVGSNAMNGYNLTRATRGLARYLWEWFDAQGLTGRPRLVIASDTRHFSRFFAELTAKVASEEGLVAILFDEPRSTPQLSFAVREFEAHAGVVITASHNPPHDNGYKVYFEDGAQVVEPHASAIIEHVNKATEATPSLREPGKVLRTGHEADHPYLDRLQTLVLDKAMVAAQKSALKIVFTPLHGVGGVIIKSLLAKFGVEFEVVSEQDVFDGRFPTVASPNPENASALEMAIEQANRSKANVVLATDPDADRLGVAVRSADGQMKLLSGNQTASLIASYRVTKLFEQGVLTKENANRAVIVKTVVTTDLLKAIAQHHGLHCVETLTGFKYIGQKLGQYEAGLPPEVQDNYKNLKEKETQQARLQHSRYYVFGGEESYGYSGADFVRDKDANQSAIMFAEVAAYAASKGLTIDQLLDNVHATYGIYVERNGSLAFEGAEGAEKISRLAESYRDTPPQWFDEPIEKVTDFLSDTVIDSEGHELPKEKMLIIEWTHGVRAAIRPSGTEPKIKYYLFDRIDPPTDRTWETTEVRSTRLASEKKLEELWVRIQADVEARLA